MQSNIWYSLLKYVYEPMSVSLDRKYLHVGLPANCAHPGVIPFHTRVRSSSSQATARALAAPRCATKTHPGALLQVVLNRDAVKLTKKLASRKPNGAVVDLR